MVKKSRKIWLIFIVIVIAALIAAAIDFIYFPTVITFTKDLRCFDCTNFNLPLDDKEYQSMDFIDVHYDISVTNHWNYVTEISGRIVVDEIKFDIVNWQKSGENFYCVVANENGVMFNEGVAFNGDFSAIRVKYSDGKIDEFVNGTWCGPAESVDELIDVMSYFGLNYSSKQQN